MTGHPHDRRWLAVALGGAVLAAGLTPAAAGPFREGAAVVEVTPRNAPPEPPSLVAGGFLEARADRVHDPLKNSPANGTSSTVAGLMSLS